MNFISRGKNNILLTMEFDIKLFTKRSVYFTLGLPSISSAYIEMTFVAPIRLHYDFCTMQYLQKRTKTWNIEKHPFFLLIFLSESKAHSEGRFDGDTS